MARTMRDRPTAWLQQESTAEPQNNHIVLPLEKHADTKESNVLVHSKPDVDNEPEGAEPNDEPDSQEEEEEEENTDAKYPKIG